MQRILIIDDDESFRRMLRLTLLRLGYHVDEAADGRKGIALHRAIPADLVLTDLIMPEQEGLETIQQLHREFPTVKVIAMSGGGRLNATDFLKIAARFGAHRTLLKPFAVDELRLAIDYVLAAA